MSLTAHRILLLQSRLNFGGKFYGTGTLPPTKFAPEPYGGPSFEKTLGVRRKSLPPCMLPLYKKPLLINQGDMQYLYDYQGKRYLDMYGGIVTVSVGHCHGRITRILQEQSSKLWHVANIYMHPKTEEYVERLVDTFPGDLKVVYLMNSGSEANDMAIMLARLFTGNEDIIALKNAYHGGNTTCIHLNGIAAYKYPLTQSNFHHVSNPDVYRGRFGGKYCRDSPVQANRDCQCEGECLAKKMYVEDLKDTIKYVTPRVAGFIAEPIQGVGGTVQYPKNYLKEAYEAVRSAGGVCIADEVQTGFGRTGQHFWSFQGHGVMPDIVTMAKGIGNGFPLAAVVTTPAVAQALSKAVHYNTYSGNPLACAVGNEVLKVLKEEKMQENSLELGTYILNGLSALRDRYDIIGDVRGKGLMIGVEMVSDPETKTPLPFDKFGAILETCKDKGLLIGIGGAHKNVYRIKPPMCISKPDADFFLDIFEDAIKEISRS